MRADGAIARELKPLNAQHAVCVAYATAAADLSYFPLQLAEAGAGAGGAGAGAGGAAPSMLSTHLVSFEVPAPVSGHVRVRTSQANRFEATGTCCPPHSETLSERDVSRLGGVLVAASDNILGVTVPRTFSTSINGLDLSGCVRLVPQNLGLVLRFTPHLTVLNLAGCHQFSSDTLCRALAHVPRLRHLDLQFAAQVDDAVLAAIGAHLPTLTRLQLMGCHLITDRGVSAAALLSLPSCALRRLNLRGCKLLTDAAVTALASRAPFLTELCLSGISTFSPSGLASLLVRAKRLARFYAELWSDNKEPWASDASGAAGGGAADDSRKTYRLLGSVRGAIRFIATLLPADDTLQAELATRYSMDAAGGQISLEMGSGGGAGMPLVLPEPRGVEGTNTMTPSFHRRWDESFDDGDVH